MRLRRPIQFLALRFRGLGPRNADCGNFVSVSVGDVHVQVGTFDVGFWVEGIEIGGGELSESRYSPEGCGKAGEDCGVEGCSQV